MALISKLMQRAPKKQDIETLRMIIEHFSVLLKENNRALDLLADAEEKRDGDFLFDMQYLRSLSEQLEESVRRIIVELNYITNNRYLKLMDTFEKIGAKVDNIVESRISVPETPLVLPMKKVDYDLSDAVGEKIARLGEIQKRFGYEIPDGFVITVQACQKFFDKMNIHDKLAEIEKASESKTSINAKEAEVELGRLILGGKLPWNLKRAIRRGTKSMKKRFGPHLKFAVRSSAIGEDGELSFAGLHDTVLGVNPSDVPTAYKQVLASLFSSRAIAYRRSHGENLSSALMAVGCLKMVPATASGVLYTLDPNEPGTNTLIVTAVHGLGKLVVEGEARADRFVLSRSPPHGIISCEITDKKEMYDVARGGGVHLVSAEPSRRKDPAVSEKFLQELARKALRIERYMKAPQDIEWAQDENGNVVFLQARTLRIKNDTKSICRQLGKSLDKYKILISNRGTITCRGIGYGQVVILTDSDKMETVPEDCILVAHHSSPQLAGLVPKANAVITDIGAPTGHLATVTREFRVPSIMDVEVATEVLRNGMEITVDAEENVIYEGKVEELLLYQVLREEDYTDTREYKLLHRILKTVAPLNLRNPQDRNFTSENCRTYHDIIRFAHEKAVDYLTQDLQFSVDRKVPHCKKVLLDVPLDLMVIDIGSGLRSDTEGSSECRIDQISCEPLRFLLEGLTAPGAWSLEPAPMDIESFMSSMAGPSALTSPQTRATLHNLAIVSECYLNLNLHLGYHLNQVDSYISDTRNDNYIYFRFSGGMTNIIRRARRAKMISIILEKLDFAVDTHGDFIVARLKKFEKETMLERMRMIGRLIGFTRQIDVHMKNNSMVDKGVEEFFKNL